MDLLTTLTQEFKPLLLLIDILVRERGRTVTFVKPKRLTTFVYLCHLS